MWAASSVRHCSLRLLLLAFCHVAPGASLVGELLHLVQNLDVVCTSEGSINHVLRVVVAMQCGADRDRHSSGKFVVSWCNCQLVRIR